MNTVFNLFDGWGTQTALIIRILIGFIFAFTVIPLQIKESVVKDSLLKLRRQMLITGIVIFLSNSLTIYTIGTLLLNNIKSSPMSEFLQVVNAVTFLILAVVFYIIYHQQFNGKSSKK